MPVLYGGQRFRPDPLVLFGRTADTTGDGTFLGYKTTATLTGKLVADVQDAVLDSHPTAAKLGVILAKQKALRDVFAANGLLLEVQGWDGSAPVKFPAVVDSIEFQAGPWVETCDYTIVLSGVDFADDAAPGPGIAEAVESWQFEEGEQPATWKVTHQAAAKGKLTYDGTGGVPLRPWEIAREFVRARLGLGWTATGPAGWPSPGGATLAAASATLLGATTPYNHQVQETVEETDGRYAVVETWTVAAAPYSEDYTVTVRHADEAGGQTVGVAVAGTIRGLYATQGDFAARYANALAAWGTIRDLLYGRATAAAGVALGSHPVTLSLDPDPPQGTFAYAAEFSNRPLDHDTWEEYTVVKKATIDSGQATASVDGTIHGVLYADDETDPAIRYGRAVAQWGRVQGLLYARAVAESGVPGLKPYPVAASVSEDHNAGTVAYAFDFDNRPFTDVALEYSVTREMARDQAAAAATITGSIKGVRLAGEDPFGQVDPYERYGRALAYFQGIEPNLLGMVALYVPTADLAPDPWSKSVEHNPLGGSIGFTYRFATNRRCFDFALSESITIADTAALPVIAKLAILGRAAGPLFQEMGTTTERKRSVVIELILPLGTNPCGLGQPPTIDVSPWAPTGSQIYKVADETTWSPSRGNFTRQVAWEYNA